MIPSPSRRPGSRIILDSGLSSSTMPCSWLSLRTQAWSSSPPTMTGFSRHPTPRPIPASHLLIGVDSLIPGAGRNPRAYCYRTATGPVQIGA
jgi:hypothetical protein